ncbi:hypothetical protein HanXRQr2_Chr04g0143151 [Helianthus annuus]|uniref:Uncharacterized protein n=1 Tax=Helianthus annuus TaxID=4232 RepID=A0A9K3J5D8_HELAN|nr:hypothetical protein HanXRQr2_Chr04g0143151 [Helianthus annuus]KAJ0586739.1 hypothetical protein HanIR_Chr04g0155171 [Helianthus annuus]KAJ0929574.1 hypothetical protein HanPSC8_Chr04g0139211 [Helianthus annuus]
MELFLMLSKGKIPFTIVSIDTCDIGNVEITNNSHGYSNIPTSALLISQVSILTIVNGILPFVNIKNNSVGPLAEDLLNSVGPLATSVLSRTEPSRIHKVHQQTPLQVSMSSDTLRPMRRDPPLQLAWSAP